MTDSKQCVEMRLKLGVLTDDVEELKKWRGEDRHDIDEVKQTLLTIKNWIVGGVVVAVAQSIGLAEAAKKLLL